MDKICHTNNTITLCSQNYHILHFLIYNIKNLILTKHCYYDITDYIKLKTSATLP